MLSKISAAQIDSAKIQKQKKSNPSFKGGDLGMSVKYLFNKDIFTPSAKVAKEVIDNLSQRVGQKGQFLNWVKLPEAQLKRINYIYDLADELKMATGNKPITILGEGGSKHTVENAINLSGLNGKNVHFYSDIDPLSLSQLKKELPKGKFKNSVYLDVSKSGNTFETKDGHLQIEKGLVKEYKKTVISRVIDLFDGNTEKRAQKLTNRHFIAVSDADASKSGLRKMSDEKGYLGDLFIHDDVGGRYSSCDDHVLFTLAYAGMKKADMVKYLEGAAEVSEMALNPKIHVNLAAQKGIFYANSVKEGVNDFVHALFGRAFEGGSENFLRQLHGESLKDTRLVVMKNPDGMHYNAEAIFDPRNKYNLTATTFDTEGVKGFENYNNYAHKVVLPAFAKIGDTSVELLKINKKGVEPEALGAWTQLKGFETIFKGMFRRANDGIEQPKILAEVLQPSVEAYKKDAFKDPTLLIPGR